MSVTAAPRELLAGAATRRLALRIALALGACALVAAGLAVLAGMVGAPAAPLRSPFGVGFREAAPAAGGFGAVVLALQDRFARALQVALTAMDADGSGSFHGSGPLVALGLVYGIVHAAGPGHGKTVIAGYLVASGGAVRRGLVLSLSAALVQALVAILLVGIGFYLVGATAAGLDRAGGLVERAGFAAIALVGLAVTWRKAGALIQRLAGETPGCEGACVHPLPPGRGFRDGLGVALAAGFRPCAGAVLLLVLAASRGVFPAGILGVLAMAVGTAATTGALAALAVGAKRLALRLAAHRPGPGAAVLAALELLAGALVLVLGLTLLAVGVAPGA